MNDDNDSSENTNTMRTSNAQDSLTQFTNLVKADEDSYEVFAEEMMYQNRNLVYTLIEQDSISPASGSTLHSFYEQAQSTAIGKLSQAQTAINNYDINGALSANNSAPVSNTVEQKQQRANELILKYMNNCNDLFSDAEKSDLYNMAGECPAKGSYVSSSRNLINAIYHTVIVYEDNCDNEANASRKIKPQINDVENSTSFNLYPNPNKGSMIMLYNLANEPQGKMQLLDVTGKVMNEYSLQESKGSLEISEQNLTNGIYFYRILVKDKIIYTNKIVIIK